MKSIMMSCRAILDANSLLLCHQATSSLISIAIQVATCFLVILWWILSLFTSRRYRSPHQKLNHKLTNFSIKKNPHCNWVWTKDNIIVFSTQCIFKFLSKDKYILYWKDAVIVYYFQCIAQYHVPWCSKMENDNNFCSRSSDHICIAHWSEMTNPSAK